MVKAGFWMRTAAMLVDLALFVPLFYGGVLLFTKLYGRAGHQMWDVSPVRLSATIGNVLWIVYSSTEWVWGASPGKMIFGMKITLTEGSAAPTSTLFLRWAAKHSVRILGLLDALLIGATARMIMTRLGLAVFYHEPMNFKLARILGEVAGIVIIGGFLLTFRSDRRALHDLFCGTAVYRKVWAGPATQGFAPVTGAGAAPLPVQAID